MALTIEQIQTNITNKGDVREIINQIADYIQANPGGGSPGGGVESVTAGDASITVGGTATDPTVKLPYLVYTALLSQTGTNAPTAIVLKNTLGEITFTRDATGIYSANSEMLYTEGKRMAFMMNNFNQRYGLMAYFYSVSVCEIRVSDDGQTLTDDALLDTPFEIRVYP